MSTPIRHQRLRGRGGSAALTGAGRKRLLIAGLLTEASVSRSALSAVADGYKIFVVGV